MADRDIGKTAHEALASLLAYIQDTPTGTLTVGELVRLYRRAKQQQGRREIADKLGIDEDGLVRLDRVIRSLGRELMSTAHSMAGHQTKTIAVLRFLGVLGTMSSQAHQSATNSEIAPRGTAELAMKQLRAIEHVLRAIMREQHGTEDQLVARLTQLFGAPTIHEWAAQGQPGDILSGASFADLASFFIDKVEFAALIERYFSAEQALTFLGDKRASAFALLDDLVQVRNRLARGYELSTIQINLVGVYYDEIVEPVQQAFDRLSTRINPEQYLDATGEEISAYVAGLQVDPSGVRETVVAAQPLVETAEPAPSAQAEGDSADLEALIAAKERKVVDIARFTLAILVGLVGIHTFMLLTHV